MAQRLLENHPVSKKVDELIEYLDKLGITIHSGHRGLYFTDNMDESQQEIRYADEEDGREVYDFPSGYEHKLLINE